MTGNHLISVSQTVSQKPPFQSHELRSLLKIGICGAGVRKGPARVSALLLSSLSDLYEQCTLSIPTTDLDSSELQSLDV